MAADPTELNWMRSVAVIPGFHFKKVKDLYIIPREIKDGIRGWVEHEDDLHDSRVVFLATLSRIFAAAADFYTVEGHDDEEWMPLSEAVSSIAKRATETTRLELILRGDDTTSVSSYTASDVETAMYYGYLRQHYLDQNRRHPKTRSLGCCEEYGCEDDLDFLYRCIENYNQVKVVCTGYVRELFKAHRLGFEVQAEFDNQFSQPMFHIRANLSLKDKELQESKARVAILERKLDELKSTDYSGEVERDTLKRKLAESDDQLTKLRKKVRKALDDEVA